MKKFNIKISYPIIFIQFYNKPIPAYSTSIQYSSSSIFFIYLICRTYRFICYLSSLVADRAFTYGSISIYLGSIRAL